MGESIQILSFREEYVGVRTTCSFQVAVCTVKAALIMRRGTSRKRREFTPEVEQIIGLSAPVYINGLSWWESL